MAVIRCPDTDKDRAVLNGGLEQRDQLRVMAPLNEPMHGTLGRALAFVDAMERIGHTLLVVA